MLLDAMGSTLGERVISPLIDKMMTLSINGINFFFTTYKDSLYEEAALYSLNIWVFVLVLVAPLYVQILRIHPANKSKNEQKKTTSLSIFIKFKKR